MKRISEINIKTIVALFFVITGATGLIYQVTWFKYISLFVGNTTYAQMIVLSTFLGGLAIGNYYFGKKSETIKNHVLIYGILEVSVGVYCFLYPTISFFVGDLFLLSASNFTIGSQNFLFILLRFLFASVLLLIPTIAMGGTLPIISKFFISKLSNTRRDIGILYFLNSLGAVWGIIFAGFFLIKLIGLNNTMYLTASLNLLIGLLAILLSKLNVESENKTIINDDSSEIEYKLSKNTIYVITSIAGLSGMAALLYEIVWVRLLINFLGSSTFAFSIMLLAFISGITAGSLIVAQEFMKKYNKVKLIILLQSAIGISTILMIIVYERIPYFLWKIGYLFNKTNESFIVFLSIEFLICFGLMLLPTIFMGMTLPVIVDIVAGSSKKIGLSVGKIFSINTIGTVVGVLITSLVFMPLWGIKISLNIGIAINFISAIILLITYEENKTDTKITYSSLITGVYILFLILMPNWNVQAMISGVFRKLSYSPPNSYEEFRNSNNADTTLYYKEGVTSNVAVVESKSTKQRRLLINGKADASTVGDMPTQVLLGQLPSILHGNPKDAFVIGFGSGTTLSSVLTHDIENVTCAEMNKEVIEAAPFFESVNKNCLDDPRVKIVLEDALTYLKLTNKKYDIIISEPSNPWIAGIGNLFSKEYFNLCKNKLNKNGVMVQWFHVYEVNDEVLQLVLNTFTSEFPNVQIWGSTGSDILLVGSNDKVEFKEESLNKIFKNDKILDDLKRINIDNAFTFLSLQKLTNEGARNLSGNYINSEMHPILEFIAPKSFYLSRTSRLIKNYDEKLVLLNNELLLYDYLNKNELVEKDIVNAAEYHLKESRNTRFVLGLTRYAINTGMDSYRLLEANDRAKNALFNNDYYITSEKIYKSYADSEYVKRKKLNGLITENIYSSTLLKKYSIKPYMDEFHFLNDKKGFVKQNEFYIQAADLYYNNNEYELADSIISLVKGAIQQDPELSTKINLEKYLILNCKIQLHFLRQHEFLYEYFPLTRHYPNSDAITILRKSYNVKKEMYNWN